MEVQQAWVGDRADVGTFGRPEFSEILIRNWEVAGPPVQVCIDTTDGWGHLAVAPYLERAGALR